MLSVPNFIFFFPVTFVSLFHFSASSFCFLNAGAVCLFPWVHPPEFAWNLVRVSALCLVLEEVKGCSRAITLACCSVLICRVKLFKIKILLPLNFSIWGFPQSFPEADGASWSCACRALEFLQHCLLPRNPAGWGKSVYKLLCCSGVSLCAVYSLTRKQPEDRCWCQGWKDTWVKKLNLEGSLGCAEKCNSNQFNWSHKEAAGLSLCHWLRGAMICLGSRASRKVQENMP